MPGRYTISLSDGRVRTVDYIADKDGFRAKVDTNEPGTDNQSPADVEWTSTASRNPPSRPPQIVQPVDVVSRPSEILIQPSNVITEPNLQDNSITNRPPVRPPRPVQIVEPVLPAEPEEPRVSCNNFTHTDINAVSSSSFRMWQNDPMTAAVTSFLKLSRSACRRPTILRADSVHRNLFPEFIWHRRDQSARHGIQRLLATTLCSLPHGPSHRLLS